jgi:FkbM family methyltransferase
VRSARPAFRLATSPIAPLLGQRMPVRGPARLLHRSYARTPRDAARPDRVLTTAHGDRFQVSLASGQEWQLWAFGCFEPDIAALFGHLVGPGDRCLDVGANIGVHTVRLGKLVGPAGQVIAIEPDPELARRNAANAALNGLDQVTVVQAAASDRAGQRVTLYRAADADANRARASLFPYPYLTGRAAPVRTVTVDEAAGGPVALIKIDVEGHEAAVVAGAAATIAASAPAIVFEYAPELLADPAQCPFDQLAAAGYRLYRICYPRHRVTGRGALALDPLPARPTVGGDLLAAAGRRADRIAALVRPA